KRLAEGFDTYRLYVGADLDADVAFLTRLRSEFGGQVAVKSLDFSHLLDWKSARTAMRRFERFDFTLVESPAPRHDAKGLAEFRRAVDHPVSEHVWSFEQMRALIEHDAVDIFNLAPIFIGGLSAARKAFAVAAAYGKRCLIGTTQELSIGVAAMAQLGAAMANLTDISDPTGPALYLDDVVQARVRYEDGYLLVPDAKLPGLGVALDPARLEAARADLVWDDVPVHAVLDRTAEPSASGPAKSAS
ncbi:MAG TPA: enolase C-terminal domain-like protein, partial [Limnochordia bacterium]|nr:enolase C-terminal domain-like protein [Limnochordia bacterium]